MLLQFGHLIADVPTGWTDFTDEVPTPETPVTLGRADGVGALQFSTARFLSGKVPQATRTDLQEWLEERAVSDGWGPPIRMETGTGSLMFASGEYHDGEDFLKAWYLSDGRNFVVATYVCEWADCDRERTDIDFIVSSLRFADDGPESGD